MKTVIIAEAGINHNGNIDTAKQMIVEACRAGADYIKFQTFVPEKLVSRYATKAEYQKKNVRNNESQLDMLRKLALTQEEFIELQNCCCQIGIGFLSTPFDLGSIQFLNLLNMDFWKIPSGEITNLPYLEAIAQTHKKVVMSTGMSELDEIQAAVDILEKNGAGEIVLLHCNTEYLTLYSDVNLLAMKQMAQVFKKPIGYSDHTNGIEVSIAAVALGAVIIEKHFTLDRRMPGPDHKASLEPEELKNMVWAIRNVEKCLGDGKKKRSQSEEKNCSVARKSIVARRSIKAGEKLTEENITIKRPGNGISPMKWYEILGQISQRDYEEDELIEIFTEY